MICAMNMESWQHIRWLIPVRLSLRQRHRTIILYLAARTKLKRRMTRRKYLFLDQVRSVSDRESSSISVLCIVHGHLQKKDYETIIVNNNPETVSTDFDIADKLYFEPLTPEDVESIVDLEKPDGAVVQFGGQTAIKLTESLDEDGCSNPWNFCRECRCSGRP